MRSPLLPILFFVALLTVSLRWVGPEGNSWKWTIGGDGRGYYAYLPALFIYHDPHYTFLDAEELKAYRGKFQTQTEGRKVNRYFAGESLLLLPFFALGCLMAWIGGFPVDGYSLPFQLAIGIAAWFWLGIGLYALQRFFTHRGYPRSLTYLVLLGVVLATNLLYYSSLAPSMSHLYSFSVLSLWLWQVDRFFRTENWHKLWLSAVLMALLLLIRPTLGVVLLLVPVLAPAEWKGDFSRKVKHHLPNLLLSGGIVVLLLGLQSGLWYWQSGHAWLWSYGQEKFHWGAPQLWQVLLGFRKGWWVYTPIALLLLPALFYWWRHHPRSAFFLTGYWVLVTYPVAAWWNWYFGDSYGHRAFIDHYPVLAWAIIHYLSQSKNRSLKFQIIGAFAGICLLLNLVQSYQYTFGILHPNAMNFEKYVYTFLQLHPEKGGQLAGEIAPPYQPLHPSPIFEKYNTFDSASDGAAYSIKIQDDGNSYAQLPGKGFGPGLSVIAGTLEQHHFAYVEAQISWRITSAKAAEKCNLVFSIENTNGENYFWAALPVQDMPRDSNQWHTSHFGVNLPPFKAAEDRLKIYVWKRSEAAIDLDNFEIKIFKPRL